jgi:hypothetical protein
MGTNDAWPSIRHHGFRLRARPYQLHATGLWTVEVEITRRGKLRAFSGAARYSTEAEATTQSLALGRLIVAGAVPGCSIDSIR